MNAFNTLERPIERNMKKRRLNSYITPGIVEPKTYEINLPYNKGGVTEEWPASLAS